MRVCWRGGGAWQGRIRHNALKAHFPKNICQVPTAMHASTWSFFTGLRLAGHYEFTIEVWSWLQLLHRKKVTTHAWNALSDAAGLQNFQYALASTYAQCMFQNPLALATADRCSIPLNTWLETVREDLWTLLFQLPMHEHIFGANGLLMSLNLRMPLTPHKQPLYWLLCHKCRVTRTLFAAACSGSTCCGLSRLATLTHGSTRVFEWQEQRFWHLYRSMPHRMSNATYHGGPTAPHVFESLRFVPHTHTLAC